MNTHPPNQTKPANSGAFCKRHPWLMPLMALILMTISAKADQSGDFTYTNNSTYVTITGYTGSGGAVVVPETILGLPVTTIQDGGLGYEASITSVSLPKRISDLNTWIFHNLYSLTSIQVDSDNPNFSSSDGVLYKNAATLLVCHPAAKSGLFVIPPSVTEIGPAAFSSCHSLWGITIPEGVTSIGDFAFFDCSSISIVAVPATVTTIGTKTFVYCKNLVQIDVAAGNLNFSSDEHVLFNNDGTTLISYPTHKTGSYAIPATVTTIEEYAFSQSDVGAVTMSPGVVAIGSHAFYNCNLMTGMTISKDVSSIGLDAFSNCTGLQSIDVALDNADFSSADGVLFDKPKTRLILYPSQKTGDYTIPETVTTIGGQAFESARRITSVVISESVTTIEDYAFYSCNGLTSATFEGDAPDMGNSIFDYTEAGFTVHYTTGAAGFTSPTWLGYPSEAGSAVITLRKAVDNASLTFTTGGDAPWTAQTAVSHDGIDAAASGGLGSTIGESWLETSVTGPGTLTFWWSVSSGPDARLELVVDGNSQPTALSGEVAWEQRSLTLAVGLHTVRWRYSKDAITAVDADTGWVDEVAWTPYVIVDPVDFIYTNDGISVTITGYTGEGGDVVIPGTLGGFPVSVIGPDAFANNESLTQVTVPDSVVSIDDYAFSGCNSLIEITLEDSLETIGDGAFQGTAGLVSLVFPPSVTSIGSYAFYESGLQEITIPMAVTSIGDGAFAYCYSMTSFAVEVGNQNYSGLDGVLFNRDGTTLIQYPLASSGPYVIPDLVETIGDGAFSGAFDLTAVTIPASVTSIGNPAFYDTGGLEAIDVDTDNHLFSSIDHVLFNEAATVLLRYPAAKAGAYSVPSGVTSIPEEAFMYCGKLTGIVMPEGVTDIGNYAFYGCYHLSAVTIPSTVLSIGVAAFQACGRLLNIEVAPLNVSYSSRDGVLFNKTRTSLLVFPTGRTGVYEIPYGTEIIDSRAFLNCHLEEVILPSSLSQIGSLAFFGCYSLKSATFLGDAPSLGDRTFDNPSVGFTVHFLPSSVGFTAPSWHGYPSAQLPVEPPLAVGIARGAGGAVTLSWPVPGGATTTAVLSDIVQRSVTVGDWETITDPVLTIDAGMVKFTDPLQPGGKGFYRVGRR